MNVDSLNQSCSTPASLYLEDYDVVESQTQVLADPDHQFTCSDEEPHKHLNDATVVPRNFSSVVAADMGQPRTNMNTMQQQLHQHNPSFMLHSNGLKTNCGSLSLHGSQEGEIMSGETLPLETFAVEATQRNKFNGNVDHIIVENSLISSTVNVKSFSDSCQSMLGNKKCDPEVVVKLLNEASLDLDMVKIISEDSQPRNTNDKHQVYELIPKCDTSLLSTVQLKILDGITTDISPNKLNKLNLLQSSTQEQMNALQREDVMWTCGYCALTFTSSEDYAEDHVTHCVSMHPVAQSLHQTQNCPINFIVRPQQTIAAKSILIDEHNANIINERPLWKLSTNNVVITEEETVLQSNNNNSISNINVNNKSCHNVIDTCDEIQEINCNVETKNTKNDREGKLEKYWKCTVCSAEVLTALSSHYLLHSKQELAAALAKLTVATYRPQVKKKNGAQSCEVVTVTPTNMVANPIKVLIQKNNEERKVSVALKDKSNDLDIEIIPNKNELVRPKYVMSKSIDNKLKDLDKCKCVQNKESTFVPIKHKNVQQIPIITANDTLIDLTIVNRKNKIKISMRKGSSRAPHPCPACGKVLSNRGNLTKHMTQHSSIKPWNCEICLVGFNSQRDCDHHHIQNHTKERLHVCPVCNKNFAVLSNLKEHMNFHGEKSRSCDICGKMFWTQKCVTRHRLRHFPAKKHVCSFCSKGFAIKWDLKTHYRKTHGTTS